MSEEKRKKLREIEITVASPSRADDRIVTEWAADLVAKLSAKAYISIKICRLDEE